MEGASNVPKAAKEWWKSGHPYGDSTQGLFVFGDEHQWVEGLRGQRKRGRSPFLLF
jgi:hypothetical protein